MVFPAAPTISAASRSARIPSFSGTWPSTVRPALSSAAEDDLSGDQLLADVLEADRRLVERHAELLRDRVERVRRRDASGDAAAPPLAAEQVEEEERQDLVGRDVRPGLVADAEAVRVAVAGEAEARAVLRAPPRRGATSSFSPHCGDSPPKSGSAFAFRRSRARARPLEVTRRGIPTRSRSGSRARSAARRGRRPRPAPSSRGRPGTAATGSKRGDLRFFGRTALSGNRGDLAPRRGLVTSGSAGAPSDVENLMPRYRGGLWLAVKFRAPAAPRRRISNASTGVGTGRAAISAGEALAERESAPPPRRNVRPGIACRSRRERSAPLAPRAEHARDGRHDPPGVSERELVGQDGAPARRPETDLGHGRA